MRIKHVMAVSGLCLFGLLGPVWAADPTGAALCVTCHDEDNLPDMSRSAHGFLLTNARRTALAATVPVPPMPRNQSALLSRGSIQRSCSIC